MDTKHNDSENNNSVKTTVRGKNGNPIPLDTSFASTKNKKMAENYFKLKMQVMEAHTSHLEDIVLKQKKELAEIKATNNKFISILAHDLRSPFSSILGVLELLTENLKKYDTHEFERYLSIAKNSANNTLSLLDNLLIWIFSQHQGENFKPVKIDLNQLLLEEIENLTAMANQKQITLKQCIAKDLHVTADFQMVKTIIRNLLTNAIKYTENFGVITASAIENNKYVEISIEDNGIGISFEAQKDLFKIDSFHSTIGTKNDRGTGLGLLICKDFVELHDGNIWLESEPGKGSDFRFTLPH